MSSENADLVRIARRRVVAKTVYLGVVAGWGVLAAIQVAIWWLTTPGGYFWPAWPILGTVVAAIAWGIPTYAPRRPVSDRRIQAELARLQRAQ